MTELITSSTTEASPEPDLADVDSLDGLHHAWCLHCHPDWKPFGPALGVPFTAWCGRRAVILVKWQSDDVPPNPCPECFHDRPTCATCGRA